MRISHGGLRIARGAGLTGPLHRPRCPVAASGEAGAALAGTAKSALDR